MAAARPVLLTVAAALLGWFGWWLGGWAADRMGLGELDILARAIGVVVLLALAEAGQHRLAPH